MINIEFSDIRTKGRTLAALTAKATGEIMHIGQLMDPQRRRDLWQKGLGQLKPLMRPIEKNTDTIAQEILDWLRCASELNGLTLAISTDIQIAGLVLPKSAKLFYSPYYNKAVSAKHVNPDIQIPSTTSHYFRENGIDLPSEGYRSSEGVNAPFQVRWPTHGYSMEDF
ncbi:MAG: hypothetical protein Q7R77_00100 [Candidatus Daviesbacteria bacterium]|nr:hypothetical protein [Candidatus Daviesbacteria bacterium]